MASLSSTPSFSTAVLSDVISLSNFGFIATVVDDAITFVTEKSECKEQVKSSPCFDSIGNEDDNKETEEPDYDDDNENSDKEGEEKQEEQTGEKTTINKVF
jgi:hypothetical protein